MLLPASAAAATFVVNSSADPGDGRVRRHEPHAAGAIAEANVNGESDTITFDLAAGNRVILLSGMQLEIRAAADHALANWPHSHD